MALIPGFSINGNALHVTRNYSEDDADAFARAQADAGSREFSGGCLDGRVFDLRGRTTVQPSILIVPQLTRNGVAYNQLPNTRTNFIQNNSMAGATGSVVPTTWSVVAPPAGITITYSASGQTTAADGTLVDYIDVTVSGTALASGNFNLRQLPSPSPVSGNMLFASGVSYTASLYISLLSGSLSGVSPNYQIQEVSGTTFVAGSSLDLSAITSSLTRYSLTRTLVATGGADRIQARYGHAIASGQVLNYTIRIASPQLEKGSVATPIIRTISGFVTVDMLGVARDGAPPDFTFTRATTATRVNASGLIESVASGVLRLDYPIGGGCPAALIEPSAQNLAFQSQAFDVSGNWTQSNVTVTPNVTATLDPAGGNTADLLADSVTTGSTSHRIYTTPVPASAGSISVVSGTTYSTSLFVKAGTSSVLRIVLRRDNEAVIGIGDTIFNVTSGTITSGSGTIENYGNGWYRCTNIGTSNFTGGARIFINLYDTAGNQSYIGTAGTNNMYIWGAQLETGAVATTYIPTTTGSATRAADVCSVSGVSGYIGQTQGTLYLDLSYEQGASTSNRWLELFGSSDFIALAVNGANLIRSNINGQSDSLIGTNTTSRFKIAWGYDSSGVVCFINGTQFTLTNGGAQVITSLDSFRIDMSSAGGQRIFNNRLRAAAIYTTRLTNDQLANITRLT
jgi:hypothetical protein